MSNPTESAHRMFRFLLMTALAALAPVPPTQAQAESLGPYCTTTARLQYRACLAEVRDDDWVDRVECVNLSDDEERSECRSEASSELGDACQTCREVRNARIDLCDLIGESRYEPDFDPADFDDPKNPSHPNSSFPFAIGNHWSFTDGEETIDIEVLDKTKSIEDVTCLVILALLERPWRQIRAPMRI